ncbi:MAG TPA: hypothetical protein VHB77_01160 [Planctomycetaceae bacterium]|nr:hypothetical protein [Planctomycetaceae bacterium]
MIRITFEDEPGRSPLGTSAVLVFDIRYEFEAAEPAWTDWRGDRYPGCGAEITLVSAWCVQIEDDSGGREPTSAETRLLGDWFVDWLETRAGWGERERIDQQILEEHAA